MNSKDPLEQVKSVLAVSWKITEAKGDETIDMSRLTWLTPFAALLLAHAVRSKSGKITIIPPKDERVAGYLNAIGFPLGGKHTGSSYCPLHHFTGDPQDAITSIYDVLDKTFPDILRGNVTKYVFAELCDNIQQHSQFTHGTLLAQYFPNMEYIDIGVMDNGITIPGSYERHQIEVLSDASAIEQAIQGVSTKLEKGRGHGLPSSFAIGTQELGGDVYILSRTGALVHRSGATNLYKLENGGLLGTAVYFRFRLPKKKPNITPYLG